MGHSVKELILSNLEKFAFSREFFLQSLFLPKGQLKSDKFTFSPSFWLKTVRVRVKSGLDTIFIVHISKSYFASGNEQLANSN